MDDSSFIYFYPDICSLPTSLYGCFKLCHSRRSSRGTVDFYTGKLQEAIRACISEYICPVLSACFYKHPVYNTDRLSFWLLYGEAAGRRQKESHVASYASLLGKFPDQTLRLDHHPSEKRRSEFCAEKAWPDREAAENHVQLPGNRHWYDICVTAIYDSVSIFQCGKTGLVTGRSRP